MKNKTLQRVLCFCLALCFCFSIAIEPIQAHAVALELGWVTWALVSYLAASGFAFAVTGGIQALQSEVEQQVDEYYTVTGIDLFQLIAQSLKMRPPNGGGLGNGFWFGAAAVAAIADFIDWVRNNKWFAGEESTDAISYGYINAVYLGQSSKCKITYYSINSYSDYSLRNVLLGTVYPSSYFMHGTSFADQVIYFPRKNYPQAYDFWTLEDNGVRYNDYRYLTGENNIGSLFKIPFLEQNGLTVHDISLVSFGANTILFYIESEDIWVTIPYSFNWGIDNVMETMTINSPTEVTEFDVQENQYVEIDFSVFENETTFEEPEQLAEAIKNQLIDTGTVPTISTEIKTEPTPTPQPTPAPTPVVPLPENPTYDDIDGLGLPTLGDALLDKFPFCLPSDFGRVIGIFKVERQTPVWEVDLYEMLGDRIPFAGDTALSIDLTEYEELGAISRWVTTIGFCLFLLLITRQMITW